MNGRVVLFYPGLSLLRPGEPVRLEVAFIASEHHCEVRGTVMGKEEGGRHLGCWLEFPAHGLVGSLRSAMAASKRRQRRFPAETVVNIERGGRVPVLGKLVDVGLGGGRVGGVSMQAATGEPVRLLLFRRDLATHELRARVAWIRGSEMGFAFGRSSPAEERAIVALVREARRRAELAHEATHPQSCACLLRNTVDEPPVPRTAYRQASAL